MSGFGTQKMPTDSLNLGFPSAYQTVYARRGPAPQFAPTRVPMGLNIVEGTDLQSDWHEQKRRDANYMVQSKVIATRNMNNRANVSHAGYYDIPKPVLSQRKFANPSNGGLVVYSSRQDQNGPFSFNHAESGSLEGGVLRTPVGMAYGKQKLIDRIQQFNAIDEARQNFYTDIGRPSVFYGAEAPSTAQLGFSPQLELAQLLESITNILYGGLKEEELRSTIRNLQQDSARAIPLIIRLGTANSAGEMSDILEYIQGGSGGTGILQMVADLIETYTQMDAPDYANELNILTKLQELFERADVYLTKMISIADRPAQERENASKALVKSLQFIKYSRSSGVPTTQIGAENRETLARLPSGVVGVEGNPQKSGAFISPKPGDEVRHPRYERRSGIVRESSRWTEAPMSREDSEHGYVGRRSRFSANTRDAFGAGLGPYGDNSRKDPLGRMPSYFGEDEGEDEDNAEALEDVAGELDESNMAELATPPTAPSAVAPGMRAIPVSEITGEPDIEMAGSPGVKPTPTRSAPAEKREIVVPDWRDEEALRSFIAKANKDISGFSHMPHKTSKPKMIRQAVVAKLQKLGYTTSRG